MSERQLQFRVGLFVIIAVAVGVGLTLQFGRLERYLEPRYLVGIEFDDLSGVHPGTPVQQSGIPIGEVREVSIDREKRKVLVVVEIRSSHPLSKDAKPQLVQSLLGEAHIDFSMGTSPEMLAEGDVLHGVMPQDPLAAVQRLEIQVNETLEVFAQTSQEWKMVGQNLNMLVNTKQGALDEILEQAALTLKELTVTMQKASKTLDETNDFISDPELQLAVKQSMTALPQLMQQTELLIDQTRQTVTATKSAVASLGQTMENLNVATQPLAENSAELTTKLNTNLSQLSRTLTELEKFSTQLNEGDGSIQRLARDPQLYRNLQLSSASLAALLANMEPIVKDIHIFSDRIARHPELLGVSGYLKGSTGLKDALEEGGNRVAPSHLNARPNYLPAAESNPSLYGRSKR